MAMQDFKRTLSFAMIAAVGVFLSQVAYAQEDTVVVAPLPSTSAPTPLRITPVIGASSFTVDSEVDGDNFDEGFSAGLLVDVGRGMWTFETGVLTLQSTADRTEDATTINADTWGIPLLAKLNFSGNPHSTVFLKAGVMPFNSTGDAEEFELLGLGGLGAQIPLGQNSSILLDATYNRILRDSSELGTYQGISLLAGFSLNI